MSAPLTPRWSAPYLAALASAAVPGLDPVATRQPRVITETVETTGVLGADGGAWVVRAARDSATGAALLAEAELLRALARVGLPFDLAAPAGVIAIADDEAGPAVVYRALSGRDLDLGELRVGSALAHTLGAAIGAIHEVGPDAVAALDLPAYDSSECRVRLLGELDEMAATGRVPPILLRRWEESLEDVPTWRFAPTLVHGDLASDRVLVDAGQVSAMLDFASAHLGDPALDLGWLVAAAPEDALESVLAAYELRREAGIDAHLLVRAQFYSEFALGRWLLHGLRTGEDVVVSDAEDMLAELADAVAAAAQG